MFLNGLNQEICVISDTFPGLNHLKNRYFSKPVFQSASEKHLIKDKGQMKRQN